MTLTYLVVADSDHRLRNYSMFRLSVGLLLDSARFLLWHPFSGTPCHWTFMIQSLPSLPIFCQWLKTFFSVNLFPTFYCDIFVFAVTVHTLVDSVIVLLFEPH